MSEQILGKVRFFYMPFDINSLEAEGIDSDAINRANMSLHEHVQT
jgi:hypothetical protein